MISSAVSGLFQGVVKPVLDKVIPDAEKRLEAEQLFFKQAHAIDLGQIEVTKIEARHKDPFVSRARPFIMWVCGASFAYAMIVKDLLNWLFAVVTTFTQHTLPPLPVVDNNLMFEVLMAMLGLGGYRTFEKIRGVAEKH